MIQNKYTLGQLIGNGTYSNVYEGFHVEKETKVAIKFDIKDNDLSTHLMNHEIQMYLYMKKYNISHTITIKSFGIYEERQYLIMDYLPYSLPQYIHYLTNQTNQKKGKIKIHVLFTQIKQLLHLFHNGKLIHRDIKPDNIMISSKGTPYFIDLGLSTSYHGTTKVLSKHIGSLLYSSYNTHKECYHYHPHDDMISFFYVVFDLFTNGDLPWKNIHMSDTKRKHRVLYTLKKYTDFHSYYQHYEDEYLSQWIQLYQEYNGIYH